MKKSEVYHNLINEIKKMPSMSNKTAEKIALWFIDQEKKDSKKYLETIIADIYKINKCTECNSIVEAALMCDICLDGTRNNSKLCIVQDFNNLMKIESLNIFEGKYFIFDVIFKQNIKNISENDQNKINQLVAKIENDQIDEIIIMLDFTYSGEVTSFFLKNSLKKHFPNIKIYRPAIGIPINSSIDYIDNESLEWSIKNKNEI